KLERRQHWPDLPLRHGLSHRPPEAEHTLCGQLLRCLQECRRRGKLERAEHRPTEPVPLRQGPGHRSRDADHPLCRHAHRCLCPPTDHSALTSMTTKKPIASLRSEDHTSELQSRGHLVCRLLLEKKKTREV